MKVFIALICQMLVFGCLAVSCIWVVAECVIYIAMDTPFNWMSVYALLILGGIQLFLMIITMVFNIEEKKQEEGQNHSR